MSSPRKKVFGPLLYGTLVACGLVAIFASVETSGQRFQQWLKDRRLAQNLRSPNPETRLYALGHLELENFASVRGYVIEALRDPNPKVRVAACRVLANQAAELRQVIPVLNAATGDENPETRLEATAALGRVSAYVARSSRPVSGEPPGQYSELGTESLAVLCRLLKDPSSDVRAEAARSLAIAGPAESSTSALVAAAGDPDHGVRLSIAEALLRLDGPDDRTAAKILCDMVADPGPVADRPLILKVLQATSEATQDQALDALIGLLSHADPAVFPDLVACLGESGLRARAALPTLEKLLDDREPSTRAAAVMAILAVEEKPGARALAVLLEMIAEKDLPQDWRYNALGRLHELNPKSLSKATPGLIRQLGDPNTDVRRDALLLLQMIVEDAPAEMPVPAAGAGPGL